ncbi:MAG: SBBP repeat-containing protein [Deltaproteobacteria bacterium]|nr:SBBP repeat-containing protein [Deltaproteobacteria bacterium]
MALALWGCRALKPGTDFGPVDGASREAGATDGPSLDTSADAAPDAAPDRAEAPGEVSLDGARDASVDVAPDRGDAASGEVAPPPDVSLDAPTGPRLTLAVRVGNARNDQGRAIHVDGGGMILLAGFFEGLLRFPGLSDALSLGGEDGFVALFTPDGHPRWARRIGGPGNDRALDVATDSADNVYVTGYFRDTVNLPGAALNAIGLTDLYLISYTRDGTFRWARQLGTPGYDLGTRVAVAFGGGSDAVYVLGAQGLGFLPGVTAPVLGPSAIVVTRFTPEGETPRSETWSSTGIAVPQGLTVTSDRRLVVSGAFSGMMTLGAAGMLTADTGTGLFVAGLNEPGIASWARRVSTTVAGTELAEAVVAADDAGRSYVAGSLSGTDYLRGELSPRAGANRDLFFAQLEASGASRSNMLSVAPGSQYLGGIAYGREGQLHFAGSFNPTADLGPPALTSAGDLDVLVGGLPAALGAPRWVRRYGGPGADEATDVVSVPGGAVVTGYFSDTMVTEAGTLTSMGGTDIFLLRFAE